MKRIFAEKQSVHLKNQLQIWSNSFTTIKQAFHKTVQFSQIFVMSHKSDQTETHKNPRPKNILLYQKNIKDDSSEK